MNLLKEALLEVKLKYFDKTFGILGVKKISKPGLRKYSKSRRIGKDFPTVGISIVSTSQGIMSGKEAFEKKLGGEVLCQIW